MAIQFTCVACNNNVEVDDAWGGRLVECPYCHETITAPAFAARDPHRTPADSAHPQSMQPPQHTPGGSFAPPPPIAHPAYPGLNPNAPAGKNNLAIVALVLACACLVLGLVSIMPMTSIVMRDLGTEPTKEEAQRYFQDAVEAGAPWVTRFIFGLMGSCGLWIAGLVCGIIAVCRPVKRAVAIAALVILALPIFVMCIGSLTP